MTIREAIDQIDAQKHNTYSYREKVGWLSRLDHMIKRLIIETHEGEATDFSGYTENTDPDTQMLVPPPFDEMYIRWLEAQIDYANGEYDHYNNSVMTYQASYDGYRHWYNRTHKPKGGRIKYF